MIAPHVPGAGLPPGHARLCAALVQGESAVTSACSTNPVRLLTPKARGRSVWGCLTSFGGGLLCGDTTSLDVEVGAGARCLLTTQSSTKVYRSNGNGGSRHTSRIRVGDGGLFCLLPDPIQPFADAEYSQRQHLQLSPTASAVLVDSVASGRAACGEHWAFSRFHSRMEVWVGERCVAVDALRLDREDGPLDAPHRCGRFEVLAALLVVGPHVHGIAEAILETAQKPVRRDDAILAAASPVVGGAFVRLACPSPEFLARTLRHTLTGIAGLLGEDPWTRRH